MTAHPNGPRSLLAGLLAGLLAVACQGGPPGAPRLVVDHPVALIDAPLSIRVDGLPPRSEVTVEVRTSDGGWTSSARFDTGPSGRIDVATASPLSGSSYSGADAMGLLWSLAPRDPKAWNSRPPGSSDLVLTLSAHAAGGPATTQTIRRLVTAPGVTERTLSPAADALFGRLFAPPAGGSTGSPVLVFGGSEGGLSTTLLASLFASHGHTALALAYFGEPGLPPALENVPLEYFTRAIALLRQSAGGPSRVAVMGISRGSEAALLLGAHFPDLVGGVAAYVPSSVANPGLGPTFGAPAWTLDGRPVPTVLHWEYEDPSPADAPQAIIAVEDIRGPLFLVSGTDDHLWPSSRYAAAIMARLDAARDPFPRQSLVYERAGHGVGGAIPYLPTAPSVVGSRYGTLDLGGSRPINARADADSWPKLLRFLAGVPAA
jgi:dienelactone hydrolase